ncbi:MAG: imidazole glycerol phosphate synthase subunit HisH [Anaerolineales bacterium]
MITLVDYNAGNLTSVRRALEHLGIPCQISADPDVVRCADKIIFPGVGAAGAAMSVLRERGLDSALKESFAKGIPILGICIGCQIILEHSEEDDTECLGLLAGKTIRFSPSVSKSAHPLQNPLTPSAHPLPDPLKIPHMGWNAVTVTQPHPLLAHLRPGDEFYFVHSFYPQPADSAHIYAISDYGGEFPVAIGKDNLFAVQFHTEKSGAMGLRVLENFNSQ